MIIRRGRQREIALQALYLYEMNQRKSKVSEIKNFEWLLVSQKSIAYESNNLDYACNIIDYVTANIEELDKIIIRLLDKKKYINSIEAIDKCILRLSIVEMKYLMLDYKIVIDEAIKLSNKFSTAGSYKIINGLLDTYIHKM